MENGGSKWFTRMVLLRGISGPVSPTNGVAGQNSPTPAEKIFTSHGVIKNLLDGKYYDPSYGKVYTNAADFEAQAIAGSVASLVTTRGCLYRNPPIVTKPI